MDTPQRNGDDENLKRESRKTDSPLVRVLLAFFAAVTVIAGIILAHAVDRLLGPLMK
jgi:hypothetical protein